MNCVLFRSENTVRKVFPSARRIATSGTLVPVMRHSHHATGPVKNAPRDLLAIFEGSMLPCSLDLSEVLSQTDNRSTFHAKESSPIFFET